MSNQSQPAIIYENEDFLVAEKPAGIPAHPLLPNEEHTLIQQILVIRPEIQKIDPASRRPGIVHRLDKNTSGLVIVAKTPAAQNFFISQFAEKNIEKKYIALVHGAISQKSGEIRTLIGRDPSYKKRQKVYSLMDPEAKKKHLREAITAYGVLQTFEKYTLIEAMPMTGRRHQIRAHMAHIHHPIAGDTLYGFKNLPAFPDFKRHFLHAAYLKFTGPDEKTYEFASPLPPDLQNFLNTI